MDKNSQFYSDTSDTNNNANNNESFDYSINGDPITPWQAFNLGRTSPLSWSMRQIVDASLPFNEWLQKNPNGTKYQWEGLQKALNKHKHNWLYRALYHVLPHAVIKPIKTVRR